MSTLFDLSSEMLELEAILSDFDGDITESDKEEAIEKLFAMIAENEELLSDKVDSYIYVIAEYEQRAEIMLAEADRLKTRAAQDYSNSTRLRERLIYFLADRLGKKKLKTKLHDITIRTGGQRALDVDIEVDQLKGDDFTKIVPAKRVIDNTKVRQYLESSEQGLAWARLLEPKRSLLIR